MNCMVEYASNIFFYCDKGNALALCQTIFWFPIFHMKIAIQQPYYLPSPSYFWLWHRLISLYSLMMFNLKKTNGSIETEFEFKWFPMAELPTFYSFPQKMNEVQLISDHGGSTIICIRSNPATDRQNFTSSIFRCSPNCFAFLAALSIV